MLHSYVMPNTYYDSLTLMRLSSKLQEIDGVERAAVMMGTDMNKDYLKDAGLLSDESSKAGPSDVCIGVKTTSMLVFETATEVIDGFFRGSTKQNETYRKPRSISTALEELPDANMAVISVPGAYAVTEAREALKRNLNVFIFSDNVSIEDEVELKKEADERELICMGPDCGTAIINGTGLGFANNVRRGNIGVVGASGTGIQEVIVLIHRLSAGVSQAIGTGGRDLISPVDARTSLKAIKGLANDPMTEVIVFISKPPDEYIMTDVLKALSNSSKPSVVVFLGKNKPDYLPENIFWADNLAHSAKSAVSLAQENKVSDNPVNEKLSRFTKDLIKNEVEKHNPDQAYLRGLYSGGTLCDESIFLLSEILPEVKSGHELGLNIKMLTDPRVSEGHCLVDLGDDFFTQGRPHPMIDYSYRTERIIEEALDPEIAVILLDVVLGYGSHKDPQESLVPAIIEVRRICKAQGRYISIVASICGTEMDIQEYDKQFSALKSAGVLVFESNIAAARVAGLIANKTIL